MDIKIVYSLWTKTRHAIFTIAFATVKIVKICYTNGMILINVE